MVLGAVVTEAATRFGDTPCFVAVDGWSLSYADLDRASDEVAAGLLARGVGEGDVVALLLPACPDYVVAYAAAAKVGAITAGVNARLTPTERAKVLEAAAPALVITTPPLAPDPPPKGADQLVIEPGSSPADVLSTLRQSGERPPPLEADPDRPLAVVFTSGTTGLPKAALFAGRQLEFITGVDTGHRWGGGAPALAGTSLAHLGPMTKLPGNLHRGGTTYLVARWEAGEALRMTAEHRMAVVAGIPTQVALMLRHADLGRHDLSSVKGIVIGGGPASPALVREARTRFAAPLSVRYSCTEAGIGVGTAFDDPPEDAEVSVGRPHAGVELTIRDASGNPLPDGEVGEVCLRSPAVMSGYHLDPEATAAAFTTDGAVRTGDLGRIDEQGRLRLAGRAKEMFVRGGYNVYPMEVEALLSTHPSVADVAVVPRSDEVMGDVGVAVVVPVAHERHPSLDELRSFLGERLAHHKLPEDLLVVDDLPLTPMDKVDRAALSRLWWRGAVAGAMSGVEV